MTGSGPIAAATISIGGDRQKLQVRARASDTKPDGRPSVLALRLFDEAGDPLPDPLPGFAISPRFGPFRYVGRAGQTGLLSADVTIEAPPSAIGMQAELYAWGGAHLSEGSLRVVPDPLVDLEARRMGNAIWRPVEPGESYEILLRLRLSARPSRPLPRRPVLLRMGFVDETGAAVRAPEDLSVSPDLGPYRYPGSRSGPDGAGRVDFVTGVTAPANAASLRIETVRWDLVGAAEVDELSMTRFGADPDGPGAVVSEGRLVWASDGPAILVAEVADGPGLIDLLVLDETGQPMPRRLEGVPASDLLAAHIPVPDAAPIDRPSGLSHRIGVRLPGRAGAYLRWRLRRPLGAAGGRSPRLDGPVRLTAPSAVPVELTLAPARDAVETGRAAVVSRARIGAVPTGFALVEGTVTGPSDGLIVVPDWRDARAGVMPVGPDLEPAGTAGAARRIFPEEGGHFRIGLIVPDGAVSGQVFLLSTRPERPVPTVRLTVREAGAAEIAETIRPSDLDVPALRAAHALAAATGDLVARRAVLSQLSVACAQEPVWAAALEKVEDRLRLTAPDWRPVLPGARSDRPLDATRVLHLCDRLWPDIDEPEARDLADWLSLEAAAGLVPTALLSLNAAPKDGFGDASDRHPDGLHEIVDGGVVRVYPRWPGLVRRQIAADRLRQLDAVLAVRLADRLGACVIVGTGRADDPGTGALARAVARALGRPFVFRPARLPLEIRGGGDVARLHRQEAALLASADAVIAGQGMPHSALVDWGVPSERVHRPATPSELVGLYRSLAAGRTGVAP